MQWHKHVIEDLEPFICVFSNSLVEAGQRRTSPLTFETSKVWIGHMQNAHGHAWECRAPSHDPITFDQDIQYQEHSIKEHGVPETHTAILSSAARRSVMNKVPECPFGDDFQPQEKIEPSTVFSSEALQSHVAAHVKEIALLVLQKLPSDGNEDAENVDSDQPLEDDGAGFVKLRASMYSVLDDEDLDFQNDDSEAENGVLSQHEEEISEPVTKLDLENKDDSGMTRLHHATQDGNPRLAESLIREGAKLGSRDDDGRTALHYACMEQSHGRADIVNLLLAVEGCGLADLRDNEGQTALHYAAERGLADSIAILIEHGADMQTTDSNGFSPFLWTVVAGQENATKTFLTRGADVNWMGSKDGKSALAWSASLGWSSITESLVVHGANLMLKTPNTQMVPLEEAAASGYPSAVRCLVSHGADPHHRDRDGWSAIHWAAEEGHLEIFRLLLSCGAMVNAVSSYGTSPLHCAANGGHASIASFLLQRGADPLKSTCHGWTALHHAAFMGHSHVVQCLLDHDRVKSSASQQDNQAGLFSIWPCKAAIWLLLTSYSIAL